MSDTVSRIIYDLLDWAEVWALVIPLVFLFPIRALPPWQKPVALYVILALMLNLVTSFISNSNYVPLQLPLKNNVVIYNLHSILRFACFALVFMLLKQERYSVLKKMIPVLYVLIFSVNFIFFEDFFYAGSISGNLLTLESYLLLIYCMLYFLSRINEDKQITERDAELWLITGLSIYVVINFFLFLFYTQMLKEDPRLADNMWTMHNVAYIILCVFLARAFFVARRKRGAGRQHNPSPVID